MLNLSSIAVSLMNAASGNNKPDAKTQNASFLLLLNSNEANFSALDSTQSLVDTLYSKDDTNAPAPQPAPLEASINIYQDNSLPVLSSPKASEEPQQQNMVADAAPTNTPALARKDVPVAKSQTDTKDTKQTKVAEKNSSNSDNSDIDTAAEKIRNKIKDLQDLMAMLASMLNGTQGASLTVVQITKVTASNMQTGLDSSGNPLNISDRLKQLLAAINASQKLPSDAQQSLSITIASFQTAVTPKSATDGATLADDANDAFLPANFELSLQNLAAALAEPASTVTAPKDNMQQLLAKMDDWVKDFSALISQAKGQKSSDKMVQTVTPDTTVAPTSNKDAVQSASVSQDANAATPFPQAPVANTAITNNTAVNNAAAGAGNAVASNSASNNTNSGGQNSGDRPAASPISQASATGPAAAATSTAPSFAKTLTNVSAPRVPVTEQVVFNIKTMVKDGSSKIQIQLDPESLGKLSIKLEVGGDGKTNVVVTADKQSTLELLQRDSRGLQQALNDAGLTTDSGSLSFNLGGQQNKGEQQQLVAGYAKQQPDVEEELAPLAVLSKNYSVQVTDGLDIQI